MIMSKENIDLRPILLRVGVAVALSLAGFLFTRFRDRKNNQPSPTGPPHPSDHNSETDVGEQARPIDDPHASKKAAASSGNVAPISSVKHASPDQGSSRVVRATVDDRLSLSSTVSGDKDWHLLPEFNDLTMEFDFSSSDTVVSPKKDVGTPRSDVETLQAFGIQETEDYEKEAIHLKNMVRELREREQNLEVQLLEFYGLKEQESVMLELQNRLKVNNMEVNFLNLKIESLIADNQRLQEQVGDYRKVVAELDAAREKIQMLQKKLKFEAERNREQILTLQKRVMRLLEQEQEASNAHVNSERTKALEAESARQLDSPQVPANSSSILEDPEIESLKVENDELAKQVERLQADRCADVEELVYLRWVNACLRYELRNFQPPHGKTAARDLSTSLSLKSEEHVKQLILEYAKTEGPEERGVTSMEIRSSRWPSSQASYISEFGDFDDSFLSPKGSGSSKVKFLRKLRRLISGKDAGSHDTIEAEDSESLHGGSSISTTTDSTSDFQFGKAHSPSLNTSRRSSIHSARYSLDIQQMKNMKIEDPKDTEFSLRRGDTRSSSERWLRTPWSSDFSQERHADQEQESPSEKSELAKFAEVLTHSDSKPQNSSRTANRHRKSASIGSFETLKRH